MEFDIKKNAFTVSQVNRYIKDVFANDLNLKSIAIKGEVSNFTNHIKTGHFYFTLKDKESSIRAVMFKGQASKVKFKVENGLNVIVTGNVQVFERDGSYQIYCNTLEPDGIGGLYLAFEQLKQKLAALNMFDESHKKPIPQMPKKIGVVTSKTGAALQDIINILTRRYPLATLVLIPALVQGENAPDSIVEAINEAQKQDDIDVLIVGRGGGSIEDLWAFNDEKVAYAVYNCKIPVISAVGHEIDFTITDYVADLRAPTPSAAAELCAPDIMQLMSRVNRCEELCIGYTKIRLKTAYERFKSDYEKLLAFSPITRIDMLNTQLEQKKLRLNLAEDTLINTKNQALMKAVSTLDALSPLKVLTRGYSITFKDGSPVADTSKLKKDDVVTTRLSNGSFDSVILNVNE